MPREPAGQERLTKYDRNEPRNAAGEWTDDGDDKDEDEDDDDEEDDGPEPTVAHDPGLDPEIAGILKARIREFQRRYDYLGPVEFADAVSKFGWQLGAKAKDYSPGERQAARAEYEFLQDRLSFWLGYDLKPQSAQGNLQSAALSLYQGAVTGGLIQVGGHLGGLPPSMLDVAGAAIWNDGAQLAAGLKGTNLDRAGTVPLRATEQMGEVGGIVDKKTVGLEWNSGLVAQGIPWEYFLDKVIPGIRKLPLGSKTFDRYNEAAREAISDKTLNTLSVYYVKNPDQIYGRLKHYVDATVKYKPRRRHPSDLDPAEIDKKSIHLAVPDFTSSEQWRHVMRAILYAKEHDVTLVVTRILPK